MKSKNMLKEFACLTFSLNKIKSCLSKREYKEYLGYLNFKNELSDKTKVSLVKGIEKWCLKNKIKGINYWFNSYEQINHVKYENIFSLKNGSPYYKLDRQKLEKIEVDASSFINGNLRNITRARGYLTFDYRGLIFIKDNTIYIPCLFYTSNNESLDDKVFLYKSIKLLNNEIQNLYESISNIKVENVNIKVGIEQEFYLESSDSKSNDHHYLCRIKEPFNAYLEELENILWKYGICVKSKHTEVAYNQFEIALYYDDLCKVVDQNNLMILLMQELAQKHKLNLILKEKPYSDLAGSGKHNNYSVFINNKYNIFDPKDNELFLVILSCYVKSIDEYQDLIKYAISSYNNEKRLGSKEAPSSIISISLGKQLNNIIKNKIKQIPPLNLDRNRTSPIAFVDNKFEFRGLGASQSICLLNTFINSILAESIKFVSSKIKQGESIENIINEYFVNHQRIIYEGNCYQNKWKKEARKRKLSLSNNLLEIIDSLHKSNRLDILLDNKIMNKKELKARIKSSKEKYKQDSK